MCSRLLSLGRDGRAPQPALASTTAFLKCHPERRWRFAAGAEEPALSLSKGPLFRSG
jgi:hypothetical protein